MARQRTVELGRAADLGAVARSASLQAIKLNQVRYVLSAADHGSFRQAAGALNIQQSSISRRVRELEARLGADLFERRPSGVRLTPAGDRFVQGARNGLVQLEDAASQVGAMGAAERSVLRIGITEPLAGGLLADLLRMATARAAAPHLLIAEAPIAEHVAALEAGRLDIAFLPGRTAPARCSAVPLWRERLVLASPEAHALAAKTTVSWSDLAGEPTPLLVQAGAGRDIAGEAERRLRREGPTARVLRQAVGGETLLRLVALGQGLAILSERAVSAGIAGVACRPIARSAIGYNAVWSKSNAKAVLRRFLALTAEAIKPSLVGGG